MPKEPLKPGQPAPRSGQYQQVGPAEGVGRRSPPSAGNGCLPLQSRA